MVCVKQIPVGPGVREEPRVRKRRGQLQRGARVLGCLEGRLDWAPEGLLRSSEAGAGGSAVLPSSSWSRRVRAAELTGLSACSAGHTRPKRGPCITHSYQNRKLQRQGWGLVRGHRLRVEVDSV